MAVSVGELLVTIGADVAAFKSSMGRIEREMSKSVGHLTGQIKSIQGTFQTVFRTLGFAGFIKGVRELAAAGDELGDLRQSFQALGGSAGAIEAAQKATAGMVSEVDLLKAANSGLLKGIPELNKNFALIAEAAIKFAEAGKGEVVPTLEKLVNAIGKRSPKALKEFGLKGKEATEIIQQLGKVVKTLPPLADGADSAFKRLNVSWADFLGQMGTIINDSPAVIGAINEVAKALLGIPKVINDMALTFDAIRAVGGGNFWLGLLGSREDIEEVIQLTKDFDKSVKEGTAFGDLIKGTKGSQSKEPPEFNQGVGQLNKELEKAIEQLDQFKRKIIDKELDNRIQQAIDIGDDTSYEKWVAQFTKLLEKDLDATIEKFKTAGIKESDDYWNRYKTMAIQQALEPIQEKRKQHLEEIAEKERKMAEDAARAFEESFQTFFTFFESTFTELIETGSVDFGRMLQKVAIEFVSTIAAGLAASLTGFQGSLGQSLGFSVLSSLGVGGGGGGGLGGLASLAGGAGLLGSFGGGAGVMLADGTIVAAGSEAAAAGVASASMPGSGLAGFAAANPYLTAALVVAGIGSQTNWFGLGGGMSAGQKERAGIRDSIAGRTSTGGIFSTPFGERNIFDVDFHEFRQGIPLLDQAESASRGLALALTGGGEQADEFQKIFAIMTTGFEDGATEAQNMTQVMVAMRGIMRQMGMTAEDAKNQLTDLFLSGKISIEDFTQGIDSLNMAAQDNLAGEGSVLEAIDLVVTSLERDPRTALEGLRLAFKEASEISIDQLGTVEKFFQQVFGEDAIEIFAALKAAGIATFEDIANASADQIKVIFSELNKLPHDDVNASVSGASSSGGRSAAVMVNLDLRGSQAGVGDEVRAAVYQMRDEIASIGADGAQEALRRSASYGG